MSEFGLVVLMIAGVIVLVAGIVIQSRRLRAKRSAALQAVAQQAGWSFAADDVPHTALESALLPLFTQGRSRLARNVMRTSGFDGLKTAIFDYRYTVGSGKNQSTIVQTVVHIKSPRLSLPPFVLRPETVFHKIGDLFGYHDIDFDSNPEFSKKYLLRSKTDEARARELFSPSTRSYFEQRQTLVSVEGDGEDLLVYRSSHTVKPEEIRAFVDDALSIARHLQR